MNLVVARRQDEIVDLRDFLACAVEHRSADEVGAAIVAAAKRGGSRRSRCARPLCVRANRWLSTLALRVALTRGALVRVRLGVTLRRSGGTLDFALSFVALPLNLALSLADLLGTRLDVVPLRIGGALDFVLS